MYINAYVHFCQISRFYADFRTNFAQILNMCKKLRFARIVVQIKQTIQIFRRTDERTDGRTNEFVRRNSAKFSAKMLIRKFNFFCIRLRAEKLRIRGSVRICNSDASPYPFFDADLNGNEKKLIFDLKCSSKFSNFSPNFRRI